MKKNNGEAKGKTDIKSKRKSKKGKTKGKSKNFTVVGIGASAGGLKALQSFFTSLPKETGMAFVVIVHLSPKHKSHMAELLQKSTDMPFIQVSNSVQLEPDHAYIIPPKKNLSIQDGNLLLSERETQKGQQAPIDLFFRALAEEYGKDAIAMILTGSGSDGAAGLSRVKETGGLTVVQSPDEAEYDSMPRSAIATGFVDLILPVEKMGREIQHFKAGSAESVLSRRTDELPEEDERIVSNILDLVHSHGGHKFSQYKRPTILRRISRRMVLSGLKDFSAYFDFLQKNPDEAKKLCKDFLMTVTNFFRDPKAFHALEEDVIPNLFEGKDDKASVRAWSCGCATGEEAYSVAMLLVEYNERRADTREIQVFASDIAEEALATARRGFYPKGIANDLSDERLKHFFVSESDGYQVKKSLREQIVFSLHNLLNDPPFARLDLIVCRNLLIYLDHDAQKHLHELFHYALGDGGYLFLGSSETADTTDLFQQVHKKLRIYRKIERSKRHAFPARFHERPSTPRPPNEPVKKPSWARNTIEEVHRTLILPHSPPGVIVNADYNVVHTLGGGDKYLAFVPGLPSQDIFRAAREELRIELRRTVTETFKKKKKTQSRPVTVHVEGKPRLVEFIVEPINEPGYENDHVHILFREMNSSAGQLPIGDHTESDAEPSILSLPKQSPSSKLEDANKTIRQLTEEIDYLKDELHTQSHDHELLVEDLKAASEEQQSIHEELLSTTEELETSKEELQSMNEELMILNSELKNKIDEVGQVNSDLENLISATKIPTIFLDGQMRIKRYTSGTKDLFNLIDTDAGRVLSHVTHQLDYDGFAPDAEKVFKEAIMLEREVQSVENGKWYLVRFRPYRNVDDRIDGVIITFVDITEKNTYEKNIEHLNKTLEERIDERTQKIRELATDLILAEQTERRRIAELLHNDLQQTLFVIQMDFDLFRKNLTAESTAALKEQISKWSTMMKVAIKTTRDLSTTLSPPVTGVSTLPEVIHWLASHMKDMHGLEVELDIKNYNHLPNGNLNEALFQIVRELLFNIVKHADVDHSRIKLDQDDDNLMIYVEDEGRGFDMKSTGQNNPDAEKTSNSLYNIRERMKLFGGSLDIDTAPGKGTKMTLSIPNKNTPGDKG